MIRRAIISCAILSLAGCQLTGSENPSDITSVDFSTMECEQIEQVFVEYKNNMDNLDTGAGLLATVGLDTGTNEVKSTMNAAYMQAKNTAKPVIKAKNCSIRI